MMPYLAQIHMLFSHTPLIAALGPLVLLLAALAATYYLRLTRQLREQFQKQQQISVRCNS